MSDEIIQKYAEIVGYSRADLEKFKEGGRRVRHVDRLFEASSAYSIEAEVVSARHCNTGHKAGDKIVLDASGNLISKLCPKRMCVYLISQLTIPVALINERLGESLDPNDFHMMKYVRCPDTGVDCAGYGEVTVSVKAVPRQK